MNLKTPALRFHEDRKHCENDEVMIFMIFSFPRFTQTQIQNDWRLLRLLILPTYCGRKTFDEFWGFQNETGKKP